MIALQHIADEIKVCPKCDLCKTRTNAVPGEGSKNARIFFIGEAPGRQEDETGRPFIGAAGKVLTKAMTEAGLKREDVFITSTVKCRPPQNRDPTQEEKAACRPYLDRQIESIKPNLIVLLGTHAYKEMLPEHAKKNAVTKVRGQIFEKDGKKYFIMFHPSAALYDTKKYAVIVDDMKKLFGYVNL